MTPHPTLTAAINRELRFLQGALELLSDLAADDQVDAGDLFEALDQAVLSFKKHVTVASWEVDVPWQ